MGFSARVRAARHYNAALHAAFEPILDRDSCRSAASCPSPGRQILCCPSQIAQPLTLGTRAGRDPGERGGRAKARSRKLPTTATSRSRPTRWIADVGANRNKATLRGNVEVRQGDRRDPRQRDRDTTRNNGSVQTNSRVDYSDPLVHVNGAGGSYSASTGAEFKSAQFDAAPARRRAAPRSTMQLTPEGSAQPQGRDLHHLPTGRQVMADQGRQHRARHP